MDYSFFDLTKLDSYQLIKDVVIHPLKVHRDPRGILAETIKKTWDDIYNKDHSFAQSYFSITQPNVARDEDQWHLHPTKQIDRFVVIKGQIVVALYDWRQGSATHGRLNLFLMGSLKKDEGYYNLLVPRNVLHCFLVVSQEPAVILNFPNQLYDPDEEGRIPFTEVKFTDGKPFSWNKVREKFNLPLKS